MKEPIEKNDSFAAWLVRRFGGSSRGTRVYWDNRKPQSGRPGEHLPPYYGYPPVIRITDANHLSGVDKCVTLAFEFHNLQRHESFQDAALRAMRKEIDREQYAMRCVELEFAAIRDTQKFLKTCCLVPPTTKRRSNIHEAFRMPPMRFDDWIQWLDARGDDEYDPREYFRQAYDQRIKPYVGRWAQDAER